MIGRAVLEKLKSLVGPQNYFDSPEHKVAYSYDGTPLLKELPDAIVRPESVSQVSAILQLANEEGFGVVARGSGSGLSGGSIPTGNSVVVLTNHWTKIEEIDEKNLTALVQPGVITAELQRAVESRGFLYPPDPGSASICTIGGNVAENAGGLRGLKYGVTRHYVLGLEVVLPNGEVIFTGGKSVKDVAGYSLKEWFVGSEGTLGIFTRILLRLIPKPETSRTMLIFYDSPSQAAETVSDIIASKITPAALEYLDAVTIRCVEDYAHLGLPTSSEAMLFVEVDGPESVVNTEAEQITNLCRKRGGTVKVASDDTDAARLRSARKVAFSALARVRPTTILEDATVPRSEVAPMLGEIDRIARSYNLTFGTFGHAGDGNLHPTCLTDERDEDEIRRAERAFEEIFDQAIRLGGTITGEHGTGLAKKKFLERQVGSPALRMMKEIKSVLDPNGILNPGKVFSLKPRCEGPLPRSREQVKSFLEMGAFT